MKSNCLRFVTNLTLLVSISFTTQSFANEMSPASWDFPIPDAIQVSQNRVQLFCKANPSKCPSGLYGSQNGVGQTAGGSGPGVSPNATTAANTITVQLVGDDSSVVLNTSQDAQENDLNSDAQVDGATINYEHEEVLNVNNN